MPPLEPYIDAHCHVWTPDVAHYPLGKGWKVEDMNPRSFTAEELLELCLPNGVGRVNLIQMSYYCDKLDDRPGEKMSSNIPTGIDNSYMLDMIKLYPDRFVGTAIVDPLGKAPDRAMADLKPKGVRAFRIAPNFSKLPASKWLEPEGYLAMFAEAPKQRQALSCLINPDAFPEVDRMATRFPETTVIIDHLGRIGVNGTILNEEVEALCALARHPKMLVKVGAFYALGQKTPPYLDLAPLIKRVVQAFGADRCMWESDCPFQVVKDKYTDSLALIRDKLDFLTADQKEWLLYRTAEKELFYA
jgi:predicted TIM-barrel fold metal-dependent hydrolase